MFKAHTSAERKKWKNTSKRLISYVGLPHVGCRAAILMGSAVQHERAEFAPEMQSGLRDHISKSDRLSVTKPRSRAQSERGIPYYNYSVSPSMLEDLTRVGRSPKPLIPARVSLPGLRGRGRGPCESSVDPTTPIYLPHSGPREGGPRLPPHGNPRVPFGYTWQSS